MYKNVIMYLKKLYPKLIILVVLCFALDIIYMIYATKTVRGNVG
ncbi:hypothetical protein LV84_00275 [Algoriphagus ratkowskyi]|uniref:Uncharacterized protein n=1 Tax=Algoriphagus ratkowskyi TaxID=57028 RepID=A0A2W7S1Q5_9BACT|nr:hypothetical protein LV84_00275 [Algoriphagus ratkowskyi]